MAEPAGAVVVLDVEGASLAAWAGTAGVLRAPARLCTSVGAAVRAIEAGSVDVLVVAQLGPGETAAGLEAVRAARRLVPPAQVVVVTSDPDWARETLKAAELLAEVLRGPARPNDLAERIGLSGRQQG